MKLFRNLLTLVLIILVHTASAQVLPTDSTTVTGKDIVNRAMKYIGVPYRSGRMNPKIGFDCSGFTTYVFQKENISLTRSSRSQFLEGTQIDDCRELRKGDLVFFCGSRVGSNIGHVGIVSKVNPKTGTFAFIHSARTGVQETSSENSYYKRRYLKACAGPLR